MANIGPVSNSLLTAPVQPLQVRPAAGDFQSMLGGAIERVEQFRQEAGVQIDRFLSGENEDVHKVALATQQAELSLELFQQVRNKVVQAYQEVMRMQM